MKHIGFYEEQAHVFLKKKHPNGISLQSKQFSIYAALDFFEMAVEGTMNDEAVSNTEEGVQATEQTADEITLRIGDKVFVEKKTL